MVAQLAMPYPLEKMIGYLNLDIERSFESMPEMMEDAMAKCRMCEMYCTCDEDVESRYFVCPNRNLLDRLERIQGKI
ncbi:MAG: hypothetical protein CMM60_08965 [Rhodospirillaceae bacterium]|jgi:hypothetical protein|nr:hypothetical protein [Rhodospirillaceae bacterium]|tara:strand:- start:18126 stop:18356 length:231 start_codon:yes stop_codon:yes gene_type:complete